MEHREFVIPVRRRWTLWILPVLALLYFIAIVYIAASGQRIRGVSTDALVMGGAGFFAFVLLLQLLLMLRRRARDAPETEAAPATEYDPYAPPDAPPVAAAPAIDAVAAPTARDDEIIVTGETQKGLRVLEYSAPAKSTNKGAVYAKTYVPVTKEYVLRIESLGASRDEI